MKLHSKILCGMLSLSAAAALLTVPAAAADAEDVFQAMTDVGMEASFVQDCRNNFHTLPHDEAGMEMNGEYHTYDEWVSLIHENGAEYIWAAIAEEYCVPVEKLIEYYKKKAAGEIPDEPYEPSVEQEKPFASMSPEEKQAYVASLPEEEQVVFLANLTPEERNSILKALGNEQKQELLISMTELGQQFGWTVTIDDPDELRFSVRDQNGTLIDSAGCGLTVDATGWNTTVPVLLSVSMILTAAGGLLLLCRQCSRSQRKEMQHG